MDVMWLGRCDGDKGWGLVECPKVPYAWLANTHPHRCQTTPRASWSSNVSGELGRRCTSSQAMCQESKKNDSPRGNQAIKPLIPVTYRLRPVPQVRTNATCRKVRHATPQVGQVQPRESNGEGP